MSQDNQNSPLLQAITKILRPLVRMLVRAGISFDDFTEMAKRVYVETAVRDTPAPPEMKSVPRVSMITGLPQREVERILEESGGPQSRSPNMAAALAEVVQQWHTDQTFSGPYGVPLELDFNDTPNRNFENLARRVTQEIPARRLLEELLAAGAVVRAGPEHYKIVTRTFVFPSSLTPGMLEYFSTIMTDLASTVEYNTRDNVPQKRIERSVFADRPLSHAQLDAFQEFARARVPDLISELDNWLARAAAEAPPANSEPLVDVGINVFQFVRERTPEKPLDSLYLPRSAVG